MRKSSKRHIRPIKQPGIRLAEKDAESLAFKAHMAALQLDTVNGLNQFSDALCKMALAMDYCGTMDGHARAIMGTATKQLYAIIKRGSIEDREHAYLKRVAGFIDDWLSAGCVTYAGLDFAKRVMAGDKMKKSVDKGLLGD